MKNHGMRRTGVVLALAGVCFTLVAAQAVAPPAEPAAAVAAETPAPRAAFTGSLVEGIARVRELAEGGDLPAARSLADRLLAPRGVGQWRLDAWNDGGAFVRGVLDGTSAWTEPLGWNGRPEVERAHVRIERGLVSLAPDERKSAERDFGRALALAPAGPLREAASYDLALLPLLAGEEWRMQIPELGGAPPTAMPPVPGAQPAPEDEAPDPLEEAKRAYGEARKRFIARLKLDWRDANTRANVELIQRRLHELDEIEREREEQQQDQDQQDQDQQDEQEDGEPGDQQDEQSEDQQDEQSQDGEDQEEPEEAQDSEDPEDPEDPEDGKEGQDQEDQTDQPQAEPKEVHLSQEELQRLLNRLAEHEKEAEALREARYRRGSRGVDKDW